MATAVLKGRNIQIEIAATYSADKTVSAVTQASPGVATSTSHGLSNNTVGYFYNVSGMVQLENQACRLKNVATDTFELQGLNTTNFTAFTAGLFKPVATWDQLGEATSYSIGGGASEKLDVTTLKDIIKQEELGLLPVQGVTIGVNATDVPTTAMLLLEDAVQTQGKVTVRILIGTSAVRVFRGEPSTPGEDVQKGQVGTGSLELAIKGFALKLAA